MRGRNKNRHLFNGYVINPLQFIVIGFLLLFIGLFIAVFGILGYLDCLTEKLIDYDSLNQVSDVFTIDERKTNNEYTYLISKDNTEYSIPTKAILNTTDFMTKVDDPGNTFLLVCNGSLVFEIRDSQENYYATFDNTMLVRLQINKFHCIVSIAIFVLIILFLIFSAHIITNAPRYPKLASLLVKKGSRNW